MKILISILLIFSHLFSTIGFTMAVHECGESRSYSLYGFSLHDACECDHESTDHTNDCCTDKKSLVKGDCKDKMATKVMITKKGAVECELASPVPFRFETSVIPPAVRGIFRTEFPPGNAPPLYVLYNVFLI